MVAGPLNLARFITETNERRTAHQLVRDTLRRAILSGSVAGGTRLVQADIAAQLQVSTTPVREALRDLASDGLILFDPHRGALVRELDLEQLKEIYEIRMALEPLTMRKAAERISPQELDQATRLHEQLTRMKDPGRWVEVNWQFHSLLEQAAASPRLASIVKSVQDAGAIYVAHSVKLAPERIAEGNAEHAALLEALRNRDGDAAARLLWEHLDHTLQIILRAY